jgi:outer membrane receptor protein involved in Fe transport
MKRFIRFASTNFMFLIILIITATRIYAQEEQSIAGKLIDRNSNQAVSFANVVLLKASDSTLIRGTISDENGAFHISPAPEGNYRLLVSIIGYKPATKTIDVVNKGMIDAGIIFLQDTAVIMKETMIVGERIKAKSESDKTTFFVTKKMLDASSTGTDVLKLIPGIQIDFMQNISLEGSRNIQIFVDGKERDRSFISLLNPQQIEKIEVMSKPSSNVDGNVTGTINIILKKERNSGINGQINAEIPTSVSEIFIRPTYSLNYGFKKLNLYTSYKGELTYLNIHESTFRAEWNSSGTNEIISNQFVKQKDWSHRFNYGFDYFLSSHDQVNFYAFYNPYSRELDGNADLQISGILNKYWKAKKEDVDMNASTFYSLYYKHNFDKEGHEITLDISNYNLNAENSTEYIQEGNGNSTALRTNTVKPRQNETSIKIDYTTLFGNMLCFSTGVKTKFQVLQDRYLNNFYYNENIFAAYGTISYKHTKYDLSLGLRTEKSVSILKNNFRNPELSFFPYTTFKYKLSSRQDIQLSCNRSVRRPNIYQLNPYTSIDDPYTVNKGNPFLKPEFCTGIFLEHSIQFNSNYFASRLFYNKATDVINNLTFINDTNAFETQVHNLGTLRQYGVQFLGTLKVGIATINPYLRLYDLYSSGNSLAKQYAGKNRHNQTFESGLSAIVSFKHDLSFSFVFQYASPKNDIQGNSFCDALYFLSLEKTFQQKFKVGIVSAIPFTKSFIYQGADIDESNFYSHYKGIVKMSNPFCSN